MRHTSRERIARAEEARPAEAEKAAKKPVKTTSARPKPAAKAVRMKIVWDVCSASGAKIKSFAYPDKEAAESATQALTRSTGRLHVLRAAKVPME